MNGKRIGKWVIVLFLLAALPGLTAVMAQGEEPVGESPVVMEVGESAVTIPWTNTESEPNNTVATADSWCDAAGEYWWNCGLPNGGKISSANDVDYWKVFVPYVHYCGTGWCGDSTSDNYPLLVDIDAQSLGYPLDASICLYSDDGYELACSNDTDTSDSMLYYNIEVGRNYYLAVRAHNGIGAGSNGKYQLLVSTPYLFSAAAANLGTGNVEGISFQAGDILAYSDYVLSHKWVLLFDLSDLGVKGNVVNLSSGWRNSDYLLLGFAANVNLPAVGRVVTPWEVVVFDPAQVGPKTTGTFQLWWDGRLQGLTTAAEKIDAIDWPNWAGDTRLLVSTMGTASVYGGPATTLRLPDEDVGLWAQSGEDEFYPRWSRFLDTSLRTPGIVDIIAFSKGNVVTIYEFGDDFWREAFVVVQGTGYNQKSVYELVKRCEHGTNNCQNYVAVTWSGPNNGWNYNIDALQMQRRGIDYIP